MLSSRSDSVRVRVSVCVSGCVSGSLSVSARQYSDRLRSLPFVMPFPPETYYTPGVRTENKAINKDIRT